MKKTVVLAILDGWGVGAMDESNPIYAAHPKTIDMIEKNYPGGALQASGIAIGLPWEEEGNSEVGHLTIGTGRIIYQHYPKITLSIESGEFFKNEALHGAFAHAEKNNSAVHLVGLMTKGNVHASLQHVGALIKMASQEKCKKLFIHLITDGRDSPPKSAEELILYVKSKIVDFGVGEVVSIVGRYYAMNRDEHWERTQKAYDILTKEDAKPQKFENVVESAYKRGFNDEYIEPAAVSEPHPIQSNDAIVFFNYREDSMRQISSPFLYPDFDKFQIKKMENIYVCTMTQYDGSPIAHIAFPSDKITHTLGSVIADHGMRQLRIAETQKYAHITYFLNGLNEKSFAEEYHVLIPSIDTPRPETHPEMMASAITERAINALHEGAFDLLILNYANPDILAHTGNFNATLEAIKVVDHELSKLMEVATKEGHTLVITSDHGNAEVLIDSSTGGPETKHNTSPVPFYLVGEQFKRKTPLQNSPHLAKIGLLSDVAPTILELLNIQKPTEMTGESLISQLML
ncbi:MAG: 2,3-bisphosphoglycerate-independent phosphoglycerate mutase [Patescibacteria group bacterium]